MANRKFLSKLDILRASDIKTEDVAVPEWGGWVKVRGMDGLQRDAFEAAAVERTAGGVSLRAGFSMRARLVALCVVDEDGAPIFTEADIQALAAKSAAALDRVVTVAQRLSGMAPGAVEDAKANFTEDPADPSTSD